MTVVQAVLSWLLLAAIFIVVEIISLGLTTIWFAGGAFVAAIAAACGANLVVQIILFLVVSIALLILTRPLAMKHLEPKTEKTNAEALIGKSAVVTQEIHNLAQTGQVKIDGMEWTARSASDDEIIAAGSLVVVEELQGVKLIVKKKASKDSIADSSVASEPKEEPEIKEETKEPEVNLEESVEDIIKTV